MRCFSGSSLPRHDNSRFSSSVISRRASGGGRLGRRRSSASGSSSIEISPRLRTISMARLRAIATIQVMGLAMRRIELVGHLPNLEVGLLHDLFGQCGSSQDTEQHPIKFRAGSAIKPLEAASSPLATAPSSQTSSVCINIAAPSLRRPSPPPKPYGSIPPKCPAPRLSPRSMAFVESEMEGFRAGNRAAASILAHLSAPMRRERGRAPCTEPGTDSCRTGGRLSAGAAPAHAHQRDTVEFGLLGRVFRLAFADLVALVEQFDLFESSKASPSADFASRAGSAVRRPSV